MPNKCLKSYTHPRTSSERQKSSYDQKNVHKLYTMGKSGEAQSLIPFLFFVNSADLVGFSVVQHDNVYTY